jgi:hypothetical protein
MPTPQIKHCVVCEDVRLERRGLVSLMGVYGFTPYVAIAIRDFSVNVGFNLLFVGEPFDGMVDIKLSLRGPEGNLIEMKVIPEHHVQKFSIEFPIVFSFRVNALFPSPDTYTMVLLVNGAEFFEDTFRITKGEPSDFN